MAESFDMMRTEIQRITPFYEDVYLYDLNVLEAPPLAYRSAHGGEQQPDLLDLLALPARESQGVAQQLYERPVYLSQNGGVLLLPAFGSLGRFVIAIKTALSTPALSVLAACAGRAVYTDAEIASAAPASQVRERAAVEHVTQTVSCLLGLMAQCESVQNAYDAEACIQTAAELMGVALMPPTKEQRSAIPQEGILPDAKHAGQALLISSLTLLSAMRNHAHARSGWLYALPCDAGYTLHATLRSDAHADLDALTHLRTLLQDGGVAVGTHSFSSPITPPKQYPYLHKKITDPRKPLCARCQCLNARCATCTVTEWVMLPYLCDVALQGIKTLPNFENT